MELEITTLDFQPNTEFGEMLLPLYENLKTDCNADENLTPFIMQWGDNFSKELPIKIMFFGRATNGWNVTWNLDNLFDISNPDRGYCPDDNMSWVEKQWHTSEDGYVTKRSQFWNVIKRISVAFYEQDWYKYVSWSNVCKVAPKDGGNPSDSVYNKTLRSNQTIFETEIKYWAPNFVILFTGGDWSGGGDWSKDFLVHMNGGSMPECIMEVVWDDSCQDRKLKVYSIEGVNYIVTLHPQCKVVSSHAKCIINVLNKLSVGSK